MQLGDLLTQDRIRVPLRADTLVQGVTELLALLDPDRADPEEGEALLTRLRAGEGGTLHRPSPLSLLLFLKAGEGEASWAALGISPHPLVSGEAEEEEGPRILLMLRISRAHPLGVGALDRLEAVLSDPDLEAELLEAGAPLEVRALRPLMGLELRERVKVEHVMVPLSYRVFPETPLEEVVGLMSRKGLRALPVVGEDLQVLGIVTAGEALRHAVRKKARAEEGDEEQSPLEGTARDVMIRSVMCVSEDQDLRNAARLMVNKDVAQLPVVREGEIVGILTRDAVLKALFGR